MRSRAATIDSGIGVGFIVSSTIHVAALLLLMWWGKLFSPQMATQETYYVDMVNLPTASPHSGSSAQKPSEVKIAPAPPTYAPVPPTRAPTHARAPASSVKLQPLSRVVPLTATNFIKPAASKESEETESTFTERMAKLEKKYESQREEDVFEKLRSKLKSGSNSKIGTPRATGAEVGSSYANFIKSRLEDALKITSYYTTRKPELIVRLTIAADGKLLKIKIERSSGDAAFEVAVKRAIDMASTMFSAPPNRAVFEYGFVFRPKNISNGAS